MRKFIDAERLREEIKSIEEDARKVRVAEESTMNQKIGADGQVHLCQKLNLLIDSLQQEQPEVDFEKELENWRHKHFRGKRDGDYSGEYLERSSQLEIARRFYELGLNTRKEDA